MRQWQAEANAAGADTTLLKPLQPPVAAETPGASALVDRLSAAVAAGETPTHTPTYTHMHTQSHTHTHTHCVLKYKQTLETHKQPKL